MIRTGNWLLGACLAALGAHAIGQSVVVPNANATVAGGDTSGAFPSGTFSAEFQTVFGAGQFSTGPIYVTGFSWRAAPGTGPLSLSVTGNVYVSTSLTYPNTNNGHPLLSTTFAKNVGPDKTLVFSGSVAINGAACAGPAPCPWANSIAFTTPFYYNPANGPLLIDIQVTSFTATSGQYDVVDCTTSTCATSSILGTPLGSPTATGFNFGGNVTQITYTPASAVRSVTYNYTGNHFTGCSYGPCPANYKSDYIIASMSFAAPLAPNLPLTNLTSSLTAWTLADALGNFSYSSTGPTSSYLTGFPGDAAHNIVGTPPLSVSTDSSGVIVDYGMGAFPAEVLGLVGKSEGGLLNPPVTASCQSGNTCTAADFVEIQWGLPAEWDAFSSIQGQWTETLNTLPEFFTGQVSLGSGVYYLQFPDSNLFGYYNFPSFPFLYHYDLGFEYFFDGGNGAAYMYDFSSGHWFYTSSSLFPNLYDFTLSNWLYYLPATNTSGHYTSNPRYFSDLTTGKIITM